MRLIGSLYSTCIFVMLKYRLRVINCLTIASTSQLQERKKENQKIETSHVRSCNQ